MNSIKSSLIILFFSTVAWVASIAQAQTSDTTDVNVMLQAGHVIKEFTLSHNERYVFTRDSKSIAMWDLGKRKIISVLRLNRRIFGIFTHPINSTYVCAYHNPGGDFFTVYDMRSLKQVEPIEISRVFPDHKGMTRKTATQDLIFKLNNGIIDIYLNRDDMYIGSLDATPLPLSGSLDISDKDPNKILVSGMEPVIWQPSKMSATTPIDYYSYLQGVANAGNVRLASNLYTPPILASKKDDDPYSWGWKQTTSGNFEPDGTIRICGYDGDISYWNPDGSLNRVWKAADKTGPIFNLQKYRDKNVAATDKGIFCSEGDQPLKPWKLFNDKMGTFRVTYNVTPPFDGGKFLVSCDNNFVLMGDLRDPSYYEKVMNTPNSVMGVKFDTLQKYAIVYGGLGFLREFSLTNKNLFRNYYGFDDATYNVAEYLPGDIIACGDTSGRITFWERGNRDYMKVMEPHLGSEVIDIKVGADKSIFYTLDKHGTIVTWDLATLSPVMYMRSLGGGEYVYMTPENYYSGSKRISDKIHFTRGREVYSFEQFDLLYNRPDIVLERLGGSPERVQLLRKAWERRARRMGVNPNDISTDTHVPTLKIANAQSLPHVTSDPSVTLNIKANDSKFNLSRLMMSINGVPVGNRHGENISAQNLSQYLATKDIALASGRNHIEVSCMNEKGAESYKSELNIWCHKPDRKPTLYLAAIGVSDYQDAAYNLGYAAKDARDFTEMITKHCSSTFGDVKVRNLTDAEATADNLKGLRDFFAQAGVDDVAILFYAGHGVLDSELEYYLATHDMDFLSPKSKGWHYDDFEDLLDGINPLTKYCFIDACHSGKIDKEEFTEDNSRLMAAGSIKFRGNGTSMTISDHAKDINNAIQTLFTDFSKGNGATVLSSSSGMEVAIEDKKIANGLFTYAIRQGVEQRMADNNQDGIIQMSELADYVNRRVQELSGGTQTPGMRVENKYVDLQILK